MFTLLRVKCSWRNIIIFSFLRVLGFYFILEFVAREGNLQLIIIYTLMLFILLLLGISSYFFKKNCILKQQLQKKHEITQKLYVQRDIDMLSGLKNRNSFARAAQKIEKTDNKVTVMVCDIDGLKFINDTLGHVAGDQIIQKAAEVLKMSLPTEADIFRIGGDEYLAIIEDVLSEQQISGINCKIHQQIERYNATRPAVPLSMSWGNAHSTSKIHTFWEVVKEADYAMYKKKRMFKANSSTLKVTMHENDA